MGLLTLDDVSTSQEAYLTDGSLPTNSLNRALFSPNVGTNITVDTDVNQLIVLSTTTDLSSSRIYYTFASPVSLISTDNIVADVDSLNNVTTVTVTLINSIGETETLPYSSLAVGGNTILVSTYSIDTANTIALVYIVELIDNTSTITFNFLGVTSKIDDLFLTAQSSIDSTPGVINNGNRQFVSWVGGNLTDNGTTLSVIPTTNSFFDSSYQLFYRLQSPINLNSNNIQIVCQFGVNYMSSN